MQLPTKPDMFFYIRKQFGKKSKISKMLGSSGKMDVAICRGIIIPYVFNPLQEPWSYYFLLDLLDDFIGMIYERKPKIDCNNFCRLGISRLETNYTKYGPVNIYKIYPATIIEPFQISKSRFQDDSDFQNW